MSAAGAILRAAAVLAALGALSAAAAEEGAIRITADSMQWDEKTGTARATGNAVVEQDDKRILADMIVAHAARDGSGGIGEVHLIEAEGGVSYETPTERALGDRGSYDLETGMLALSGNVRLARGDSEITGEELTIDFESGVSQVSGSGDSRAVVTFEPGGDSGQ